MNTNRITRWMVILAVFFLGGCATTEQSATSTGVSGDGFTRNYKPYVKHTEFFTVLKEDYDRLYQRHKNYWDYYKPGYSFKKQNNIYLREFISTAPEQIGSVRKGYADDFKAFMAAHFRGMGYTIDEAPKGLILEANLWRLDDNPGGRIWIPFNFGQHNAAFGVEMKIVDQKGDLLYGMVYDCTDFTIKKAFNKFKRDFDIYTQ